MFTPKVAPANSKTPPTAAGSYAIAAGILGWTLDSFDFFVVVFMIDTLASHFSIGKSAIVFTLSATLVMRPVGALLFGALADRWGRRKPMIAVIVFFSLVEVLSGLAPNYTAFLVLRFLYGIGMGGFWGVGASLTLESSSKRWRGLLSGLLQGGYPLGYLLAAIAARTILPVWGWRVMFWAGLAPAAIAIYAAYKAPESLSWQQNRISSLKKIVVILWGYRSRFTYMVIMLTLMICLSHGTQDLYPDFLKTAHKIPPDTVAYLAMIYSLGALLGTVSLGHYSEIAGRRKSMIAGLSLCILVIPFWAFGTSLLALAVGAFVMQVGVQGAWGVIPAHLNELSPGALRSLFPGLVYQLGVLFGSQTNTIEYALRDRIGYSWALTVFEVATILALLLVVGLGPEQKGTNFFESEGSR